MCVCVCSVLVCVCVHVHARMVYGHVHHSIYVEVRGKFCEVSCLLSLLHGWVLGTLNSGYQVCTATDSLSHLTSTVNFASVCSGKCGTVHEMVYVP